MDLPLIDMRTQFTVGDLVELQKNTKTSKNRYKKGDMFVVDKVIETTVYLISDKGPLTIHRFLVDLIKQV